MSIVDLKKSSEKLTVHLLQWAQVRGASLLIVLAEMTGALLLKLSVQQMVEMKGEQTAETMEGQLV